MDGGEIDQQQVLAALRDVIDPEMDLNVVGLALVYSTEASGRDVRVVMTMTTPACPLRRVRTGRSATP